jgi:hypothetical protein
MQHERTITSPEVADRAMAQVLACIQWNRRRRELAGGDHQVEAEHDD